MIKLLIALTISLLISPTALAFTCVPYSLTKLIELETGLDLEEKETVEAMSEYYDDRKDGYYSNEALRFLKKTKYKGYKYVYRPAKKTDDYPLWVILDYGELNHAIVITGKNRKTYSTIDNLCGGECEQSKQWINDRIVEKWKIIIKEP